MLQELWTQTTPLTHPCHCKTNKQKTKLCSWWRIISGGLTLLFLLYSLSLWPESLFWIRWGLIQRRGGNEWGRHYGWRRSNRKMGGKSEAMLTTSPSRDAAHVRINHRTWNLEFSTLSCTLVCQRCFPLSEYTAGNRCVQRGGQK